MIACIYQNEVIGIGYGARMEKTGAASDWEAGDRVVSSQAKDLTEEAKYGKMKIIKRKESRSYILFIMQTDVPSLICTKKCEMLPIRADLSR